MQIALLEKRSQFQSCSYRGRPESKDPLRTVLAQVIHQYIRDLALSDSHFFPTLKEFVCATRFRSDEEVIEAVKVWLNGLSEAVYDEGTKKLLTDYKCRNVDSDYIEK